MASLKSIGLKDIIIALNKKGRTAPAFLATLKRISAKKHRQNLATSAQLIKVYHKLVKNKTIAKNTILENLLRRRKIRTLSGVAVITVLTRPHSCPGRCIYCPSEKGMPKSYLKNEPAANRAWLTKFDPYTQVKIRLKALQNNGHRTDKIELIVLGGTWSSYPKNYQYWFIKECFRAANKFAAKSQFSISNFQKNLELKNISKQLKQEQRKNESAKNRIVGLTLETRPDRVNLEEIKRLRDLGCTRIELGVQSIFDDVLATNRRGHKVAAIISATRLLKDAGFKINYHVMLNLPGSTPARDFMVFKKLFSNPDFQPDLLKIYPCVVLKTAPLYQIWQKGNYRPYSKKKLVALLIKIKKIIPPYVRIQRIIRDIPSSSIVAGSKISNLRQLIDESGQKKCRCIRCREIRGQYSVKDRIKLFRQDYLSSGGQEIFLSYESPNREKLYALLRLRLASSSKEILSVLKNAALIRELHTYGELIGIGKKDDKKLQHAGLGKKLIAEAERIIKDETPLEKIAIIAGVGVRGYYQKLGYRLENEYMVKNI